MTTVHIESGICGFSTLVRVSKSKGREVGIAIESTCEQIQRLGDELQELDMMGIMKGPINQNAIYIKAGECKLHNSCPVPCGIHKAAEAELGLALKKDVKIVFRDEG